MCWRLRPLFGKEQLEYLLMARRENKTLEEVIESIKNSYTNKEKYEHHTITQMCNENQTG